MRESYLVNDLIKSLYPVVKLWRANVGNVKTIDGRNFRTGLPKGFSDLFGILPANISKSGFPVPIFLEAKVHPNKPSDEQIKFIEEQRAKGAVAGVIYSVEEAWELLLPHLK